MITQSGCFGKGTDPDPIDDINEAAEALGDIMGTATQPTGTSATDAAAPAVAALLNQYMQRVRLLTWAVIAMAVVLVVREVK